MRNFSAISSGKTAAFLTAIANGEYYTGNPVEVLSDVLVALSDAFESDLKAVKAACGFASVAASLEGEELEQLYASFDTPLSPSEMRVITDLFRFFQSANRAWDDDRDVPCGATVFFYANLNSGRNVSWTLSVM